MDNDPIGKFQILGKLGEGAHSTILHIRRASDSKQYALKVVPINDKEDMKYLDQARHEYRIARQLSHPSLLRIYKLEEQKKMFRVRKAQMLMEYVNGDPLDEVRGLNVPRLLQIFDNVATAMIHMHRRKIFHADIKPNNIMISKSGEVKVVDFGLAWLESEPKDRVQGTLEYMAPEQAQHHRVNAATDIYNLGATMYRMFTWKYPPKCAAATEGVPMDAKTFHSLLKPTREVKPGTPKPLCDLIDRCLRFKPQERPQRMSEVQNVLDRLVDKLATDPEDLLENVEW